MLPMSRTNTFRAARTVVTASVNTSWTTAISGRRTRLALIRSRNRRTRSRPSGIIPNAKLTMPAIVAENGRTILGNWICLISRSWLATEPMPSMVEVVNHFQGRIAAKMNSG